MVVLYRNLYIYLYIEVEKEIITNHETHCQNQYCKVVKDLTTNKATGDDGTSEKLFKSMEVDGHK